MKLKVDMHSDVPIYLQIVERIRHMIATGALPAGSQLPPVRQLAKDLHVNFNTVARAYSNLDQAGIVSSQQGRGTYVRERSNTQALSLMRGEKLRSIVSRAVVEAFSLGYPPAEILATFDDVIKCLEEENH